MTRLLLALALLLSTGCQWNELVNPSPPPKCFMALSVVRRVTISSGDSTWTATDTSWLGTTEVPCKAP